MGKANRKPDGPKQKLSHGARLKIISIEEPFTPARSTQAWDPIVGSPFTLEFVVVRQLLICDALACTLHSRTACFHTHPGQCPVARR